MKNTFLTIIFALLLPLLLGEGWGEVKAQNSQKTDSLFTILKTAKADTTLLKTYNALCREYRYSNPDTALYFGTLALNLATVLANREAYTELVPFTKKQLK